MPVMPVGLVSVDGGELMRVVAIVVRVRMGMGMGMWGGMGV